MTKKEYDKNRRTIKRDLILAQSKDYYYKHRKEVIKRTSNYNIMNKDKRNARRWMKQYGLTVEKHNEMLIQQCNKCAICGSTFSSTPIIDHDHETGKVRGLLCLKCNSGLGMFNDSVNTLNDAIKYLEKQR